VRQADGRNAATLARARAQRASGRNLARQLPVSNTPSPPDLDAKPDGGALLPLLALCAVVAFALNFGWEMAQMPLYATRMSTLRCLGAAGGDAGLTAAAFLVAVAATRLWSIRASWIVVAASALAAVLIERRGLSSGRWAYASAMPTVAGVGVAPLMQLPLLAVVSRWLGRRILTAPARTVRAASR